MARKGKASKGSRKWTQVLVNQYPELLNGMIEAGTDGQVPAQGIQWVSPLEANNYLEGQGSSFLEKLELGGLKEDLKNFWPHPGPSWDALAKSDSGKMLLVEAKAHLGEKAGSSYRCKAKEGGGGRRKIENACVMVKEFLKANSCSDWLGDHYQFANRLAHLYLLRKLNDIPAFLVMLYFLNDSPMGAPSSATGWQIAIEREERALGIPKTHQLSDYVIPVFLDVGAIQNGAK